MGLQDWINAPQKIYRLGVKEPVTAQEHQLFGVLPNGQLQNDRQFLETVPKHPSAPCLDA